VRLQLSKRSAYLGPGVKMDGILVSSTGPGFLRWVAEVDDPDLVAIDPPSGMVRNGESMLFAALRNGIDFDALPGPVHTQIRVRDLGGVEREILTIDVAIAAEPVPEPGPLASVVAAIATLVALRRRAVTRSR
jgi:hypothetical protein